MHIDEVAALTHCTEIVAAPLVVFLRLSLELGDILRPKWKLVVVVLGKVWELDVDQFALNTCDAALHPTLNLLNLFIAVDPNIDHIARLKLLPPNLI